MSKPAHNRLATWRISPELVERLEKGANFGRRRKYRPNESLYDQGEMSSKFYFIVRGLVQVSMIRADGTEVVLEFMGPQTICGEGSAFDGLPRFSSGVALEETEVIEFDAGRIEEIAVANPAFASTMLRVISLKQRILAIRLEHLASREPEGRIMELLRRLGEMFAVDHPEGRLLVTQLTHDQIGAMTGVSRVTVTRALSRLRKSGAVGLVDGHLLVRPAPP